MTSESMRDAQQTMEAYVRDLLNHGDYARHFSDDVGVEVQGTPQRYEGREAVRQWIDSAHAFGEAKVRDLFTSERHAAAEAEFIRRDGVSIPYSVIYDLADGKITALRLYFTGPLQS